ncbi:cellulose binding domain-containing protein [Umezawaea beigongshangensis]|uniref:cellulose binding domain-containing protein n=1 Tax=Umezawaea beigongshangensis TaxID=2780383 RepID=UPI0018F18A20|nr:cellulose binding domain-containing protein [Umezawaea beigongshangensis]
MSQPLAQLAFKVSLVLAVVGVAGAVVAAVVGWVLLAVLPRQEARADPPPTLVGTTPLVTPPPVGPSTCTAELAVHQRWDDGFIATIVVTNAGERPVRGWSVEWTFSDEQEVRNSWNAQITQNGRTVHAENVEHNRTIAAAGTTSFGLQGSGVPPRDARLVCRTG